MSLLLFYAEPESDRWLPYDRYPRRVIRRIVRGKSQPGGHARVFLNLRAGLDRIGARYRVNDYAYANKHPRELACIIGKSFLLDKIAWRNPVLFGSAGYSHPLDDPDLLDRLPVKKILVPGPWMKAMCRPYWGGAVDSWPVGIDTDLWAPSPPQNKAIDTLIYDKVRWRHDEYERSLIEPIRARLRSKGHSFAEIRYGHYEEAQFLAQLARCRTMIFLCEHETQGIAYQQALACNVPILAWDRGGPWQDPAYYPGKVTFEPVTSVPYWDARCGNRFAGAPEFADEWNVFWRNAQAGRYRSRDYILENLTLEKCAQAYVDLAQQAMAANNA